MTTTRDILGKQPIKTAVPIVRNGVVITPGDVQKKKRAKVGIAEAKKKPSKPTSSRSKK